MKKIYILILFMCLLISGFFVIGGYSGITVKVVDSETGKPIEGAVAMAEWTTTKGLGNTYTVSTKVVETVSSKEGNIVISGCWCPFANAPSLTIYKKGYVAWNNEFIFPGSRLRKDFAWKSGQIAKLERFKEFYSYITHESFISSSINSSLNLEQKQYFLEIYQRSEEKLVIKERNLKIK